MVSREREKDAVVRRAPFLPFRAALGRVFAQTSFSSIILSSIAWERQRQGELAAWILSFGDKVWSLSLSGQDDGRRISS
jgi:hypothetical protein